LNEPHQRVARTVLTQLKVDVPVHMDTLAEALEETPPSEIIAALFELEMLGLVRQLPGRNFVKVW
jgi:DNA processing protein